MRKIFIHAGFSKTGSSAIQRFLETKNVLLNIIGLNYKSDNIDKNLINSGNAEKLFHYITQGNYKDAKNFLLEHSSTKMPSILSSEELANLSIDQWNYLKKVCEDCSIKIEKIIFYVRDVDKYMTSSYDQGIKRHGMSISFLDYVSSHEWKHYESCLNLSSSFDSDTLIPLHYESCSKNLLESFISKLFDMPPNIINLINESQKIRVNRSLTNLERVVLKKINSNFGMVYSEKISNMLLTATPDFISSDNTIDDYTSQVLRDRFQYQVDNINKLFFGNNSLVCCLSKIKSSHTNYSQNSCISQNEITYNLLFEFLINEIKESKNSVIEFIINKLIKIIKQEQKVPDDFPEGFSFLEYAILNLDVLLADVNLKEHYIKNGREEGRLYSIL